MGLWREDTSYRLGITSSILGGYSYGFQDIEISGVRACCWPIGMASNGEIQMKQATAISWRWTHPRTKSGEGRIIWGRAWREGDDGIFTLCCLYRHCTRVLCWAANRGVDRGWVVYGVV